MRTRRLMPPVVPPPPAVFPGSDGWETWALFPDRRIGAMPRFHFNVHDGVDKPDLGGTDLPDVQSARAEALKLAGEIIRDAGARADLGEEWRVEVTDSTGLTLFRMDFVVAESPATARHRPDA